MDEFVEVAGLDELPESGGLEVTVGGRAIGVFKAEGEIFAIDNECPHRGGPLHEGPVSGCEVICPWHGWTFALDSGECTFVAGMRVASYRVKVENDRVWVLAPRGSPDS